MSLLRQQKRSWILRNIIRYFVAKQSWFFFYTDKKTNKKKNSQSEFQKVKAPQVLSRDNRPLQTNSDTSPKALWETGVFSLLSQAPASPLHVWCPCSPLGKKKYLEEKCGAAVDRGAAGCPPTPWDHIICPLRLKCQILEYKQTLKAHFTNLCGWGWANQWNELLPWQLKDNPLNNLIWTEKKGWGRFLSRLSLQRLLNTQH